MNFKNMTLAALIAGLIVGNCFAGQGEFKAQKEQQDKEWKEKEQRIKEHEQQEKERKFLADEEEETLPEIKEFGVEEKPEGVLQQEVKKLKEKKFEKTEKSDEKPFEPKVVYEPLMEFGGIKGQVIYDNQDILSSLFLKEIQKEKGFIQTLPLFEKFFSEKKGEKKFLFGSKFVYGYKDDKYEKVYSRFIASVSITADGKTIVFGGHVNFSLHNNLYTRTITILKFDEKIGTYVCTQTFDEKFFDGEATAFSVSIAADGKTFVSGECVNISDYIMKIRKLDEKTGEYVCVQTFDKNNGGHTDCVKSVSITANGKTFVSGGDDKKIKIWQLDEKTGEYVCVQTFDKNNGGHDDEIEFISITADGKFFISRSQDNVIKRWKLDEKTGKYVCANTINLDFSSVYTTPDGKMIVAVVEDYGKMKVWKTNHPPIQTFNYENGGHTNRVKSVSITADGKTFVSGANDGAAKLWMHNEMHETYSCAKTFYVGTPNEKLIVCISNNRTIVVEDHAGSLRIYRLGDFLNTFNDLSFQQLLLVIKLQRDVLKGEKKIELEDFEQRFFFTLPKIIQVLFSEVMKDYSTLSKQWNKKLDEEFKDIKKARLQKEKEQKEEMLKKEKREKEKKEEKKKELEDLDKQIQEQEEARKRNLQAEESPYLKELKRKAKQMKEQGFTDDEPEIEKVD